MKKILTMSILTGILTLLGCKSNEEKFIENHKVIVYKTPEYFEFEKSAKFKIDEAWKLQKEFSKKNNETPENWLFFIIDGNYVFSSNIQPQIPQVSVNGLWVNSKSGEVKKVQLGDFLRYYDSYNGDGKIFPF